MKQHYMRITSIVLIASLFMISTLAAHSQVSTMGGELPESGTTFYLNTPVAMAKDSAGNIYVADMGNHRIVVVNQNGGLVHKFGSLGTGNGQFDTPFGVAIDMDGNILVADTANHRVQKFDANFNYLTQWGSEGSGDGQFGLVREIAIDSQNRYHVCDEFNDRIQVFNSSGTYLYQYGGTGDANGKFNLPQGIAIRQLSTGDKVYICDTYNNRVQVLDVNGNYITQLGTGARGDSSTKFYHPRGVNIDTATGDIYIADTFNHKIKVYTASHTFRFSTTLGSVNLEPCYPCQVLPLGSNKFVVSDTGNSQLLIRNQTSILKRVGQLRTTSYGYVNPAGATVDRNGNLYVTDSLNHRVLKYNASGTLVSKWGGNSGNGGPSAYGILYWQFTAPKQIWYDDAYGRILVADAGNSRIQVFNTAGTWISNFGYGVFSTPMGVCTDSSGNIYIVDTGNNRVMKCNSFGITIKTWGGLGTADGKFNMPTYITCDSKNNLYVVDNQNCRVQKFNSNGTYLDKWGTNGGVPADSALDNWGTGDGDLFLPIGIACDENDNIYVTDTSNNRIQVFDSDGNFLEKFGSFGGAEDAFFSPQGIACKDGKVYIVDALLNRISIYQRD